MLFDAAAVLTSVAQGPVAEAFVADERRCFSHCSSAPLESGALGILDALPLAPEISAIALQDVLPSALPEALPFVLEAASSGSPAFVALSASSGAPATAAVASERPVIIAPRPDIRPSDFTGPGMASTQVLRHLSTLPTQSLTAFLADNPTAINEILASQPAAPSVSAWWRELEPGTKSDLIQSAPQLVGNLEGVPYPMRNAANRGLLDATMAQLQATISGSGGRVVVEQARRQLHMLEGIRDSLGGAGSAPRSLLSLDVTGQGKAAVVIGDLHTADYVSFLIPGMFFTVDGQMEDWTESAVRLYEEQVSWLHLLADPDEDRLTVATIAWLGYETPNLTNVGTLDLAYVGRDSLAHAVEGLQSIRKTDQPYISLLAHSYGSTAALMALTEYEFEVDALAMVGSPGSNAQSVDELHVRGGNVFVGEASWDPVPNSSFFGSDPGAASYGAKPMGVDGGRDDLTGNLLSGSIGHNEYFGPGTESMRNMALVGIDRGDLVSTSN